MNQSYKITGMTCTACAVSVESFIKPLDGIHNVTVNYPNQSALIDFDDAIISIEKIKLKLKEIGYDLLLGEDSVTRKELEDIDTQRLERLRKKLIFSAIFSVPVFVMAMFFMGKIPYENWIMLALSLPVLFWSGAEFYTIAWKKLTHFSANMDTLVALSTGTAFIFSLINTINPTLFATDDMQHAHVYYESAVVIITLILLGRYLEEKAKSKTSSAIKSLMGLTPKKVTVIRNGEEEVISIADILKGELVVIKPGDKIPVDAKVKKGESYIDESMISGEPIPVLKTKGDEVFAGTINQKGSLRILATKIGKETLLSQIIQLVENAQSSKHKIQNLVDKIAGIFVPIVIIIAFITFFIWYAVGPEPKLIYSLISFITVLIIACPCALGLATPTALMVGIGKGAQQGILIKDAQALETAYKIDALILDKTGTITEGKPKVTDCVWTEKDINNLYASVFLSIEKQSEHPLAEAIVNCLSQDYNEHVLESFKSITGKGTEAYYDGEKYLIGNKGLMLENLIDIPGHIQKEAERLKLEAKSVVFLSVKNRVEAIFAIADEIKEGVKDVIFSLRNKGIDVYMLTGDNEKTAKVIADKVGIKNVQANVLPEDKGNFVKLLQQNGKVVAMAGDGINDSHALAQADVGIAMGSGTDIAMDNAGITLMYSDLKQISNAILLSKATMKTIKQNLFWAFVYNVVALPIAAGALYPKFGFLLSPMIAGAAMSMSSVSVLANSLRLRNKK
jgi:P-type Cu2+ transporter